MNSYLLVKYLHIASATVLIGTGAGLAFFMFMAARSKNQDNIYYTARTLVVADWLFTAPAVVIQLLTGIILMNYLNYGFQSPWFTTVIGLYLLIGACWVPVVVIQYRIRNLSGQSGFSADSPSFRRLMRHWVLLGCIAFGCILILLALMVFKPLSPG